MSEKEISEKNKIIIVLVVALICISFFIVWQLKKSGKHSTHSFKPVPSERLRGAKNAKLQIVGFNDFSCEKCAQGADVIGKFSAEHPSEISYAFKYFPLHDINSGVSAFYADCIAQQNEFWRYHDQLFRQLSQWQEQVNVDTSMLILAKTIEVDMSQLSMCLEKGNAQYALKADKEEGRTVDVKNVPAYFVNGKFVGDNTALAIYLENEFKK